MSSKVRMVRFSSHRLVILLEKVIFVPSSSLIIACTFSCNLLELTPLYFEAQATRLLWAAIFVFASVWLFIVLSAFAGSSATTSSGVFMVLFKLSPVGRLCDSGLDSKWLLLFRSYRQAQAAVLEGIPRLHELGVVTKRPEDYFAQMAKADTHMTKVREKLLSKKVALERSEKARKMRELKKFGKKVSAVSVPSSLHA